MTTTTASRLEIDREHFRKLDLYFAGRARDERRAGNHARADALNAMAHEAYLAWLKADDAIRLTGE